MKNGVFFWGRRHFVRVCALTACAYAWSHLHSAGHKKDFIHSFCEVSQRLTSRCSHSRPANCKQTQLCLSEFTPFLSHSPVGFLFWWDASELSQRSSKFFTNISETKRKFACFYQLPLWKKRMWDCISSLCTSNSHKSHHLRWHLCLFALFNQLVLWYPEAFQQLLKW